MTTAFVHTIKVNGVQNNPTGPYCFFIYLFINNVFFLPRVLCCNHVKKHFRNKHICWPNIFVIKHVCWPTVTRCSRARSQWNRPEIDRFNSDDVDFEPRRNSRADPQPPLDSFCWEVKGTTREAGRMWGLFLDF